MLVIRYFEDEVEQMFSRGQVRGSTHLGQGQEAVAVGASRALRRGDSVTCTYRGHAALLAMGATAERCFGEILGKTDGLCRGKGGSMHLTDVALGVLGSFAIVGANLPVTVGAALAAQYRGQDAVSLAFFGDGSTNIGAFHESLNLAAIWHLPAIFVCENNLYGEYSRIEATTSVASIADRAVAYGIPGVRVDGNDVLAVRSAVGEAVERARSGAGPTLLEALTYRHRGHSRTDPATYRPPGELEEWLVRDPIARLAYGVVEAGVLTTGEVDDLEAQVEAEVLAGATTALGWSDPESADRLEDVFADG